MTTAETERLVTGLSAVFATLVPAIEGGRLEERAGYRWVSCPSVPMPGFNGIWVDRPGTPAAALELESAIAEVERRGGPCWIELRDGQSQAMEAEVLRLGFAVQETLPGMVAGPSDIHADEAELEIVRAEDAAALGLATDLVAAGFEVPREIVAPVVSERMVETTGMSVYIGRIHGQAVTTATGWLHRGSIGIFSVATPPPFRGRGFGTAVTKRAIKDGFAAGADLAWLQSSPAAEAIYRRIGFRQVETYLVLGRSTPA